MIRMTLAKCSRKILFSYETSNFLTQKRSTLVNLAQGLGLTQFNFANGSISTVYGPGRVLHRRVTFYEFNFEQTSV